MQSDSSLPDESFILDQQNNLVRVPLAKKGKWYHSKYGTVEFSDRDFESLEHNFKSNVLGFKPYITFGHLDEEHQSTDSHRKRGDLLGFDKGEDTLFGIFQAKPEAFEAIKSGDYEFASGEFTRNFIDKETGKDIGLVFERGALTNSPFIPFEEKDKALALSNSFSCFKLSMSEAKIVEDKVEDTQPDTIEEEKEPIPSKEQEEEINLSSALATPEVVEEKIEEPIESVVEEIQEQSLEKPIQKEEEIIMNTAQETKEEAVAVTTDTVVAVAEDSSTEVKELPKEELSQNSQLDIAKIVSDAVASVTESYKAEISALKDQVKNQEILSNRFSAKIEEEQKVALSHSLSAVGVPPALVERLHQIKQALSNNSNTIKLSQGDTEVDVELFRAITTLVTDALGVEPIYEEQVGRNKKQDDSFMESLKSITERNKKLVKA
jgi:hypothetical protein